MILIPYAVPSPKLVAKLAANTHLARLQAESAVLLDILVAMTRAAVVLVVCLLDQYVATTPSVLPLHNAQTLQAKINVQVQ
jgi:hypothetical protein